MPENPSQIPFPPKRENTFAPEMSDADVDPLQDQPELQELKPGEPGKLALFRSILRHDTRLRRYQQGEIILRMGDYGNSAFLILAGKARVVLQPHLPPSVLGRRDVRRKGVWRTIAPVWNAWREPESFTDAQLKGASGVGTRRGDFDEVRVFLQDVPRVIGRHTTEQMGAGEFFGETSALSRTPRGAMIFADSDEIKVLEIRWQGLRDLMKSAPEFDAKINRQLREFGVFA